MASEFLQQFYEEKEKTISQREVIEKLVDSSKNFHEKVNAFFNKYYGSEAVQETNNVQDTRTFEEMMSAVDEPVIDYPKMESQTPIYNDNFNLDNDINDFVQMESKYSYQFTKSAKNDLDMSFNEYTDNLDIDSTDIDKLLADIEKNNLQVM